MLHLRNRLEVQAFGFDGKRYYPRDFGFTQLLYFQCLPLNFIYANHKLKRRFLELKRKFPNSIEGKVSGNVRVHFTGVPSPISALAFLKMSYRDLVAAFGNFDEISIKKRNRRGGAFSLGQAFYQAILTHPTELTHLSLRLVDEDIPIDFKLRGFEALVKTLVEGREAIILDVFKRIVRQINLDGKHTLELIRATDYFVKLKP